MCYNYNVKCLLKGIDAEQLFIIELFYFDRLTWPMICDKYREAFKVYKEIRTLRYKRDEALETMSQNCRKIAR